MIFKSIHHTVIGQERLLPSSIDFIPSIIIINGKPATSRLDNKNIDMGGVYNIERVITTTISGCPLAVYTLLLEQDGQIYRLPCPVPFRQYFYTMRQMREININKIL